MKKAKRSIKRDLLFMSIIPIIVLVTIVSLVAGIALKLNMVDEVEYGLKCTVVTTINVLEKGSEGDITKDSSGNLMKGEFILGQDNNLVDGIKKLTNTDISIFSDDIRITSSVLDNKGKRVLGTKVDDKVIEKVLKSGESYFDQKVNVEGRNYFGYYSPLKDKSGNTIGMVFAGKPSADVERVVTKNNIIIICIGLIVTLIAGFLVFKKTTKISDALEVVSNHLLDMSNGDLTNTIDNKYLARQDEIGLIAKTSQVLKDNLRNLIGKTANAVELLTSNSTDLQVMSKDCFESTKSVDAAMNEISGSAVSQAENTQNASKQSIDMGELIKVIYSSIKSMQENTDSMSSAESEAGRIVEESTEYNNITIASVKRIAEQTDITNESAKKIREAIALITDIAEQTNLLSLNASIEAARAGEAGKGFAVVAEEIQSLAEESNKSAKVIEKSISELIKESETTVKIMKDVENAVNNQKNVINNTKDKFNVLSDGVTKSVDEINKISIQTEGLDKIKEEMIDILNNLSAIAEENAASTEETSASMNELSNTIENVSAAPDKLKELADELDKSISVFKL